MEWRATPSQGFGRQGPDGEARVTLEGLARVGWMHLRLRERLPHRRPPPSSACGSPLPFFSPLYPSEFLLFLSCPVPSPRSPFRCSATPLPRAMPPVGVLSTPLAILLALQRPLASSPFAGSPLATLTFLCPGVPRFIPLSAPLVSLLLAAQCGRSRRSRGARAFSPRAGVVWRGRSRRAARQVKGKVMASRSGTAPWARGDASPAPFRSTAQGSPGATTAAIAPIRPT